MNLPRRTVAITGAASGIGRATVDAFAAAGCAVIAVDINGAALKTLQDEQPEIEVVEADISDPDGAASVISATHGRIDVLFNNAGVSDGSQNLDETSEDAWDLCMRVNLTSAFLLCRRAIPLMISNGSGVIINTSSVAGLRGGKGGAAYAASKFGLVGLTQHIAAAYGSQGIRCNAIVPGPVETGLKTVAPRSAVGSARLRNSPGRPERAKPEEIAAVVLWLANADAQLINGAAIPLDSGWLAW